MNTENNVRRDSLSITIGKTEIYISVCTDDGERHHDLANQLADLVFEQMEKVNAGGHLRVEM